MPTSITELRSILLLLYPQMPRMLLAGGFMAIVAFLTAGYAWLVGPVIRSLFFNDAISPQGNVDPFSGGFSLSLSELSLFLGTLSAMTIGGLLIGAAILKGMAFYAQQMLVIRAGQEVLYRLRQRMFAGLLHLNPLTEDARETGSLVSRFTVDAQIVEHAVTSGIMGALASLLQVISLATLAMLLSPDLGLVGLIAFPPIALLISRMGRVLRRRQGSFYDAWADVANTIEETRGGLQVLQSFDARPYAEERFEIRNRTLREKAVSAFRVSAVSSPLNEILGAGALGVTLWYAHARIADSTLTPDAFISFFTALFLLYRPVKSLGSAVHSVQTGLAALERIDPVLTYEVPLQSDDISGIGLQVRGLCAGYEPDETVLRDIDFDVPPGSRVCVAGASGSGKTTLMNVLGGYLRPFSGTVTTDMPVAVISQESFLFDDTIADNVRIGRLDATSEDIRAACEAAGVLDFATSPRGISARTGPGGNLLSAGQRQRVCLARAILSRARLILLDEVTSALDGNTESLLMDRLETALFGRTVVMVTHRIQAAKWSGRVLMLDSGQLIRDGHFDQLWKEDPVIRRLFGDKSL